MKETKNIVSNDIEYYAYIINKAILNDCVFTKEDEEAFNNMFSKRQRIALMSLKNAIQTLPDTTRSFFEDTFVSMIHYGK